MLHIRDTRYLVLVLCNCKLQIGTLFPLSYNLQLDVQIQPFQLQEIPGCTSVRAEIYRTKNV